MSNKKEIMVTVCIVTYNQEKWIRQTLDSILSQQTDYPFEIIIGEDHGIDGTRAICQEYADKNENVTLLPSPTNLGVTANWIQCIQAGSGKYIMTWMSDIRLEIQMNSTMRHIQGLSTMNRAEAVT
jgi:glycosyltransferase involved in cell wall biosynthesis